VFHILGSYLVVWLINLWGKTIIIRYRAIAFSLLMWLHLSQLGKEGQFEFHINQLS
jgi:hypothetical protein